MSINTINATRVVLPFCFGYMLAYLAQDISGYLAQDTSQRFNVQHHALSLLTSALFLAFAVTQIPLGILLDRYNPARVASSMLVFAALGAYIITIATQIEFLALGRILLGLAVSTGLMTAFRAIYDQFPPEKIPLYSSIVMASGGLGAMSTDWPYVIEYIQNRDWQDAFYFLSASFLFVGLLLFFCLPRRKKDGDNDLHENNIEEVAFGSEEKFSALGGIITILTWREFWLITPTLATVQGLFLSVSSLWVVPWLLEVQHFTLAQIPIMLVFMTLLITCGQLLAGWMGSFYKGNYEEMSKIFLVGSIIAISALMMICFVPSISPLLLWVCFLLFAPFVTLGFPMLLCKVQPLLAGRAITLMNFFTFLCAFAFQQITDTVLNTLDTQTNEVLFFAYRLGFSIPAMFCLLSIICLAIMRSKNKFSQ